MRSKRKVIINSQHRRKWYKDRGVSIVGAEGGTGHSEICLAKLWLVSCPVRGRTFVQRNFLDLTLHKIGRMIYRNKLTCGYYWLTCPVYLHHSKVAKMIHLGLSTVEYVLFRTLMHPFIVCQLNLKVYGLSFNWLYEHMRPSCVRDECEPAVSQPVPLMMQFLNVMLQSLWFYDL